MSDSRPEELIRAEELSYNGKVEEALNIVTIFEKRNELTPKDQLSALILKGKIYYGTFQVKKVIDIGERAYQMSQELGLVPESIEALNFKANVLFLGYPDEALNLIFKAEKLMNSLLDEPSFDVTELKVTISLTKIWIYILKSDYNNALDLALKTLTLGKEINNKVLRGNLLGVICYPYWHQGDHDTALEYAMKCLNHFEKINFQMGIAHSFYLFGQIYSLKGEFDKALDFCEKSLKIEKISHINKVNVIYVLGRIYREKGELEKALKYAKQTNKLAKEISDRYVIIIVNNRSIGEIYMRKGENNQAIKYFKKSLVLSEKVGYTASIIPALFNLFLISLDNRTPDQAEKYLKRLEDLSDQYKNTLVKHGYPLGKALMLKTSKRMADHTDAARLLKQIVDDDIIWPQFHIIAIVSMCELLLEELSMYNSPEIIDELNPLITQLLKIAEKQHSYSLLAEVKLLQAKLALILMNLEEAKQLLTEAQRIAELHGLQLLARKISSEHDILLEQSKTWDSLKEKNAPMADRIDLASVDGVIDRLRGTSTIEPPELVDEQPTLLLILAEGGALVFSHSFVKDFSYEEDIIGSFLTAFATFSGELFSKGLDRAKFGEDTILMESVEQFSLCYLFKGQTYLAIQKLSQFKVEIENSTPLLQTLKKFYKTSQVLELKDNPFLESVIEEIFIKKSIELNV